MRVTPAATAFIFALAWLAMCGLIWLFLFIYTIFVIGLGNEDHWLLFVEGELMMLCIGGVVSSLVLAVVLKIRFRK